MGVEEVNSGRNMGKKNTSSNWMLATVYGGLAIATINPIAGALTAFACYQVHKKLKADEGVEREKHRQKSQDEFREKFHARQHYASYEDYLMSATWQEKREAIIRRSLGKCEKQDCNRALTEVHHIWYPRIWGNEPQSALIGLCREHHEAEHQARF
jgi:hypothetical protein